MSDGRKKGEEERGEGERRSREDEGEGQEQNPGFILLKIDHQWSRAADRFPAQSLPRVISRGRRCEIEEGVVFIFKITDGGDGREGTEARA